MYMMQYAMITPSKIPKYVVYKGYTVEKLGLKNGWRASAQIHHLDPSLRLNRVRRLGLR